jgi:hypothetical protein
MRRVLLLAFLLAVLCVTALAHKEPPATCYGDTPCRACKNCKYCKHCAKEGGTCGICKAEPTPPPKKKSTPKPKPRP